MLFDLFKKSKKTKISHETVMALELLDLKLERLELLAKLAKETGSELDYVEEIKKVHNDILSTKKKAGLA